MQVLLLILLLISATVILVLLIAVLGLWMKGLSSIVFPGLGLIVSTSYMFVILLCAEIIIVLLAAYMVRYAEPARVLSGIVLQR